MSAPQFVWLNGELRPSAEAAVPLATHGLHYGTGVFEGIRAYATRGGSAVFRLREHLERMAAGAEQIGMPFDVETFFAATLQVLQANKMSEAYVRPLAVYALGGLALDVGPLSTHQAIMTLPWKTHLGDAGTHGVRLCSSQLRRNPRTAIPPLKLCGAYVNSVIAKLASTRAGFDEALFVDDTDHVCEATGENVFLVQRGEVIAVEHADALPGITRATIQEITHAKARPVTRAELLDADEVFLTGTSAEVAPVVQLDDRRYPVGPITRELQKTYASIVRGESSSHDRWLTKVGS